MADEIFISIDIEADGHVPGLSSMLSCGAAAYNIEKELLGTFSCNFELLPDAKPEKRVSDFWEKHQAEYDETRKNMVSPEVGIRQFITWLKETSGNKRPIAVAYPAVYDFPWIDYYTIKYTGRNPFGHSKCIDIKTYAWSKLGGKFSYATKRNFPKSWFDPLPHTHIALDDALQQGTLFINMLRESEGLPRIFMKA